MKEIAFVTTNSGKISSLSHREIDPKRYSIVQASIELPEIQAESSKEIVIEKAKEAYRILKRPVIVHDASFHIPALNGFPGPYIKYVQNTIGPEGILRLLEEHEDRSCYFFHALAYIDGDDSLKLFTRKEPGTISKEYHKDIPGKAWGSLWGIYIPDGYEKPLAALSEEELKHRETIVDILSEFSQFAKWLNATKE